MQAIRLRPASSAAPVYHPPSSYTLQPNYSGGYTMTPATSAVDMQMQLNEQAQQNQDAWAERARQQDFYNACMMSKGWVRQRVQ